MKNGGFANKDAALFFVECGRRAVLAPPSEPPLPPLNFPDSNIFCFRMQPLSSQSPCKPTVPFTPSSLAVENRIYIYIYIEC